MSSQKLSIGILAPTSGVRDSLSGHIEATQLAFVKAVADEYSAVEDDNTTQRFIEARPDIIIVDMEDQRAAIKALFTLHGVLPETWLYASAASNDPQLIIETMQAGAREYLAKPVSARSLATAFGRCIDERQRLRADTKVRGKIFSVTAAKGGVGATSVVINLGTTLAQIPEPKVAILDLDSPIGDAASYLNMKPQFTLSDALASAARLDPVLLETFLTKAKGVSLLSGPKQFKPGATINAPSLAKLLRVISSNFTHTFIDLPPGIDQELLQIVTDASEAVLVVMTPELPAVWRTHRLLVFLASLGCGDRLKLILNRDDSREEINGREITRALNHPIYWRLPNNYSAAISAINKGKPIVEINSSSLATSYRKLTRDLTGLGPKPRRGVLGLFSS